MMFLLVFWKNWWYCFKISYDAFVILFNNFLLPRGPFVFGADGIIIPNIEIFDCDAFLIFDLQGMAVTLRRNTCRLHLYMHLPQSC